MVDANKGICFYTDVCGNEILEKYSVCYNGYLFEGDTDGYNTRGCESWESAKAIYDAYPDIVSIHDNEYGATFSNGDWY